MPWLAPKIDWTATMGVAITDWNRIEGNTEDIDTRLGGPTGPKFFRQSAVPTGMNAGDQWYDTSVNRLKMYSGTAWIDPLKYQ